MPQTRPTGELLEELFTFLRIPSISSGDGDQADLRRGAEWVCGRVREVGGEAEVVETSVNPIAVGRLRSSKVDAPHVLVYGHYDVQTVAPLDAWLSPPFEPEVRDGWIYGRGASDDKGSFHSLLAPVLDLARAGELPCHVTVLSDGEEEIGGDSVVRWLEGDQTAYDAAVIYDSEFVEEGRPALTTAVRGVATGSLRVQTGTRDVHSGLYGGAALNAAHVLADLISKTQAVGGRLVPELEVGIVPPSAAEIASWVDLPSGREALEIAGIAAIDEDAVREFYDRTTSRPTFDVNAITCRDARQHRTIIPCEAVAAVSMRLAPGQDSGEIWAALERHLTALAPEGAEIALTCWNRTDGCAFDPDTPALRLARTAISAAVGTECALVRSGGAIAIMPALARRGTPAILTGVGLPLDNLHAPNERLLVSNYELGLAMSRNLIEALAGLKRS